ncbi:hypothetical protein ACSBR1_006279 [Camellia fascicularis]
MLPRLTKSYPATPSRLRLTSKMYGSNLPMESAFTPGSSSSSLIAEVASTHDAKGNDVDLGIYKGKVLLIVNVASQCGLTNSNYKELSQLYE